MRSCDSLRWFIFRTVETARTARTRSVFLLIRELKQPANICPSGPVMACAFNATRSRVHGRQHERWHWRGLCWKVAGIKPTSRAFFTQSGNSQVFPCPLSLPLPCVLSETRDLWSITPISSISCTVSHVGGPRALLASGLHTPLLLLLDVFFFLS